MIYHLFPSGVTHLSNIIKGFIKNSHHKHFFYIVVSCEDERYYYLDFFKSLNYTNYSFIGETCTLYERFRFIIHRIFYPFKERPYKNYQFHLYAKLNLLSVPNLLIHGELSMYGWRLYSILSKSKFPYAWVCWGKIPERIFHGKKFKITVDYYKQQFFKNISFILCLTNLDCEGIKSHFPFVSQIYYCPYASSGSVIIPKLPDGLGKRVLIGNSGHYLDSYLEITEVLRKFTDLEVTYMVPYGVNDFEKLKRLKSLAHSIWKERVHFWDKTYKLDDYIKRIQEHTVYICNVNRQTGLGAAGVCFLSGLKVYLKGTNYDNFTHLNLHQHHINELSGLKSSNELLFISEYERNYNRDTFIKSRMQNEKVALWESYFEILLGQATSSKSLD